MKTAGDDITPNIPNLKLTAISDDTNPEIPDSNISIVAGGKHMTVYSVPFNL